MEAEKAALRALALNSRLAKAHSAMAYVRSIDLSKWREADQFFRAALKSYPDEPLLHVWYAAYLGRAGAHEKAIQEARAAVRIDPISMSANQQLAVEFFRAQKFRDYLAQARELVAIQPLEASGYLALTRALEWTGEFEAAEEALRKARLYGSAEKARSFECTLRAAEGRRDEALVSVKFVREYWRTKHLETNILAGIYGSLGMADEVADILEEGYSRGDHTVLAAATNPYLQRLKNNARIQAFLKRLGF